MLLLLLIFILKFVQFLSLFLSQVRSGFLFIALLKASLIWSVTIRFTLLYGRSHAFTYAHRHMSLYTCTTAHMRRKLWSRLHGVYLWPRWPLSVSPIQRSEPSDEGGDASARLRASLFLLQCLYSLNSTSLSPMRWLSFDPRHGTRGEIPSLRPARFFLSVFSPLYSSRTFMNSLLSTRDATRSILRAKQIWRIIFYKI